MDNNRVLGNSWGDWSFLSYFFHEGSTSGNSCNLSIENGSKIEDRTQRDPSISTNISIASSSPLNSSCPKAESWFTFSQAFDNIKSCFEIRDQSSKIKMKIRKPDLTLALPYSDCCEIANIVESALTITPNLAHLSTVDLFDRFTLLMQMLKETKDSNVYNAHLRETEEIYLVLKESDSPDWLDKIAQMKAEYESAFQALPEGPGSLTQKEVNFVKHLTFVPHDVVCENGRGQKFNKPPISIAELNSLFNSLGFCNFMYSRDVLNFEGIDEICDVFMLGTEQSNYYSLANLLYSDDLSDNCGSEDKIKELLEFFFEDDKITKLGYKGLRSFLIKKLQDQEKATRLIEQGFQICVALMYPISC